MTAAFDDANFGLREDVFRTSEMTDRKHCILAPPHCKYGPAVRLRPAHPVLVKSATNTPDRDAR
ncbi:MAG TPA: hypothetical protein VM052_03930, partial [Candidatus Limnocylindrales bacterium]|nr:hypothetical protein [Candidatus Limnocylindrales bacterium]